VRISKWNSGFYCVCSALAGVCSWGLGHAQVSNGSASVPPRIPGQNPNGIQIYLRSGLKTHGSGQRDYTQFLADWSKLLTQHGAVVDGSLHAPLAQELDKAAVLVIYKRDSGFMTDAEREVLESFVKRGRGIVSIHDALCGPDPKYFATLLVDDKPPPAPPVKH
jgi:hypothetical protein